MLKNKTRKITSTFEVLDINPRMNELYLFDLKKQFPVIVDCTPEQRKQLTLNDKMKLTIESSDMLNYQLKGGIR